MPRPEDVSREHIDAAVIGFLKGEKDADWTEVSLVTLHPREEIRVVLRENLERYRTVNEGCFLELLARLKPQGVSLHACYNSFRRRTSGEQADDVTVTARVLVSSQDERRRSPRPLQTARKSTRE